MTRTWAALLQERPENAERAVPVQVAGEGAALLVSWTSRHHPHPRARVLDPRSVGDGGPPMEVSWVELEEGARPLFDAPEVLEARRRLLRDWPSYGATSMVTDGVRLAGSVVLRRPGTWEQDDPFARLGAPRLLRTEGFFLPVPRPTGPALERYAGMPWPFDQFPETQNPRQESA